MISGKVIHVRQIGGALGGAATPGRYLCARCRRPLEYVERRGKKPHFAHRKGEGEPACEMFVPREEDLSPEALQAAGAGPAAERPAAKTRVGRKPTPSDPWEEDDPLAQAGAQAAAHTTNAANSDSATAEIEAAEVEANAQEVDDEQWDSQPTPLFGGQDRDAVGAAAGHAAPIAPPAVDPTGRPAAGWGADAEWVNAYGDEDLYGSAATARDLSAQTVDRPLGTPDFLFEDLNARQREAVAALDGPVLVVAGAGSGKTRVITRRIAHMLVKGVPPWRITALTFTNKAAGEMRKRIETLIHEQGWSAPAHEIWMSTFHSICARILRREAHHLGLDRSFSIYDEDDANTLIKQLLDVGKQRIDYSDFKRPATVRRLISEVKNGGKALEDFEFHPSGRLFVEIFDGYNKALRANNAADFDDLLLLVVKLFNEQPAVKEQYARRFRYVLIDEFQDTNPIQYEIVKALSSVHRNICATGDPDQSIYGWRGADIRNILNFEHDFPDTRQVVLDQNYRSTQLILDAASAVIGHNKQRKEKRLFSELGAGQEPLVTQVADETAEAEAIADGIAQCRKSGGRHRDCAVFYRINAQSGPIEQALVTRGIPYAVVGGTAFYQRKEVKDALAYLRLAANPSDDVSFQRVVNWPRRKIGPGALSDLEAYAKQHNLALLPALRSAGAQAALGNKYKSFAGFLELIERIAREGAAGKSVVDAATVAIHDTGLMKEYAKDDAQEMRKENLIELVNAAERFGRTRGTQATLVGFLENVALVSQVDRWDSDSDHVTLMTLHMAKGLEFPQVWIAGLEDGLFPLVRQEEDPFDDKKIEEERRLMYVGLTRAQQAVQLLYAASRMRYGNRLPARPSRFLDELPLEGVRYTQQKGGGRGRWGNAAEDAGWRLSRQAPLFPPPASGASGSGRPGARSTKGAGAGGKAAQEDAFGRTVEWEPEAAGTPGRPARKARPGGAFDAEDFERAETAAEEAPLKFEDLEAGLRVRHRQYRLGVIVSVEDGSVRHPKVIILFDKYGEKEFSGRLVELWQE